MFFKLDFYTHINLGNLLVMRGKCGNFNIAVETSRCLHELLCLMTESKSSDPKQNLERLFLGLYDNPEEDSNPASVC